MKYNLYVTKYNLIFFFTFQNVATRKNLIAYILYFYWIALQ